MSKTPATPPTAADVIARKAGWGRAVCERLVDQLSTEDRQAILDADGTPGGGATVVGIVNKATTPAPDPAA